MRRLRLPLTALSLLFALVDAVVGFHLVDSGWPKWISLTSVQKGVEQVHATPIPFTGSDWLILVLVIGAHAVLFHFLWKAWHSPVRG